MATSWDATAYMATAMRCSSLLFWRQWEVTMCLVSHRSLCWMAWIPSSMRKKNGAHRPSFCSHFLVGLSAAISNISHSSTWYTVCYYYYYYYYYFIILPPFFFFLRKTPFLIVHASYMPRVMTWVNYFLYFKNSQDLKVLGFFAKLYPRVSGLVATLDPRVMFIILIITLNLS